MDTLPFRISSYPKRTTQPNINLVYHAATKIMLSRLVQKPFSDETNAYQNENSTTFEEEVNKDSYLNEINETYLTRNPYFRFEVKQ